MRNFGPASSTIELRTSPPVSAPTSKGADSLVFCLIVSLLIGLLYTILLMGPRVLNPRDIGWLTPDPVTHYVGWEMLRHDPHWHLPLTYTTYVGYPVGESAALFDFNPLMAVALKPLSPILPEPFQYLGIEIVLCCALQFFFAWRLFRLFADRNTLGVLLASAFFMISPPLTYRMVGHYSLINQWALTAALLIFFQLQLAPETTLRKFVVSSLILSAVVVAINPYLAFEVLMVLTAAVASLLWQRRLSLSRTVGFMALLGVVCGLIAYLVGFFISGGKGYAGAGYRYYSMNLLAPFDPQGNGSILYRALPHFTEGQYEGYNYLGAGVILLIVLVVAYLVSKRGQLKALDKRWVVPLLLCCLVLTLMAFSTKVTFGSHTVLDVDPQEKLTHFFAPLRACGRLFWVPYYTILIAVLVAPLLLLRKPWGNVVLAVILILQVADTAPLRRWVRATINHGYAHPLRSPLWSALGSVHKNLVVLPAWQCDAAGSPGGGQGYAIFGLLAAEQKMRINSYYAARYTEVSREYHCSQSLADLSRKPLDPDAAYVVTPLLAYVIAQGPTGPGKCHDLDGFILCSVKSDFGLGPTLKTTAERVRDAIQDPGFEDADLAVWPSFQNVKAVVSGSQVHSGTHSLSESEGEGSVYQDITGLEPGRVYVISAWVSSSPGATAQAQIALYSSSANLSTFSPTINASPQWQLLTHSMAASDAGTLRLHLFRRPGSGTLYWDDLTIYLEK